ncbi:hypothetical protein [Janthinobacterium sp. PC23-8]|uniref:hypothetical protein n=1 Tax=Janthinobacterium sp. PC23-8 TaxID=2012679 RepID=UPI00113FEDEF|nr:hypothetical protein [Janthinobacterium sp. PC23-8]
MTFKKPTADEMACGKATAPFEIAFNQHESPLEYSYCVASKQTSTTLNHHQHPTKRGQDVSSVLPAF